MSTGNVNNKVTNDVTNWKNALADAELGLEKAQVDVTRWKGTIAVIRDRIKQGASWPGQQSSGHAETQQHSV